LDLARNASHDVDKPVQQQLLKLQSTTTAPTSSSSASSLQSSRIAFEPSESTQELESDSSLNSNSPNNNNNHTYGNSSNCLLAGEEGISWDALQSVFLSVLPQEVNHPWRNPPAFTVRL